MKKRLLIYGPVLLLASCTSEKAPQVVTRCETPAIVSFNNHIKPIFDRSCNMSGCHSGSSPAGNLNLEPGMAYNALMNGGYIDTVTPKFSLLYAQMNSVSNPMPPTGKLDSCSLQLVLKWIEQKAKNN